MTQWCGKVESGTLKMNASVFYQNPSNMKFGNWYGSGTTDDYWEPGQYDTNIGTIIVNSSNPCRDVGFKGTGSPKGAFAEFLGLNK
jgi:hypothetical protein